MEWSKNREFNPMNSLAKGLTYYDNMVKILGWMEGKNKLPPPIEASLDPTAACNNSCYYCSSNQYLQHQEIKRWGEEYLETVICKLIQWGVKGLCWGGREATLNLRLAWANRMAVLSGIETAIVTNGVNIEATPDLFESLLLCNWIGVSVDTTSPEIYKRVRGTDDCEKVWNNIVRLGKNKTTTIVSARALILPETAIGLYEVAYRARESGCNFVLIRPADLERHDLKIASQNQNTEKTKDVLEKCHELETKDFGVFTIFHKYDENFKVTHKFTRCLASPLVYQLCADKTEYLCVDHRVDTRFKIEKWGSDQHRELIKSIVPDRDCSRCTWSKYNEIMESIVIPNTLGRNFP